LRRIVTVVDLLSQFLAAAPSFVPGISPATNSALLGWPPESTFYKYKAGQVATLPYDIRYSEPSLADSWVRLPNTNPAAGPGEFLPSINDDVSRRESSAGEGRL